METEDKIISIKLKVSEWNYVLQALLELPAKIANPINNLIVQQAKDQLDNKENTQ